MKNFFMPLFFVLLLCQCEITPTTSAQNDIEGDSSELKSIYNNVNIGFNLDAHNILQLSDQEQNRIVNGLTSAGVNVVRMEYNAFHFDGSFPVDNSKRDLTLKLVKKLKAAQIHTILLFDYMSFNSHGIPQSDGTLLYNAEQIRLFLQAIIGSSQALMPFFYDQGGVRTFEIWNEPNQTWRVTPKALAQALNYIYKFRSRYSGIKILTGAFESGKGSHTAGHHPITENYIKSFYQEIRANNLFVGGHLPFDGLSLHPYGWFGAELEQHIKITYLQTMAQFGDTTTPLWITEVGSSESNDLQHQRQISDILNITKKAQPLRLQGISFFTYQFYDTAPAEYHYGFVRLNGQKRPAFYTLKKLLNPVPDKVKGFIE